MAKNDDVFKTLYAVNVNGHTKTKKAGNTELTYLSWPYAWAEVKKKYPDAHYEIIKYNGLPYVYDPHTGYMVYTAVTINGITHEMWLPVMDGANKAMKAEPYKYIVGFGQYQKTKVCEAATMFDINKTIMRCLVKNLAMFGLGLYIYADEDLPQEEKSQEAQQPEPLPIRSQSPRQQPQGQKTGAGDKTGNRSLPDLKAKAAEVFTEKGIKQGTICELYKVRTFDEMTAEKLKNALANIDKILDFQNKGQTVRPFLDPGAVR